MTSWLRGRESLEHTVPKAASFKTKGLVFQGALAFYDQIIGGGRAEVLKTLATMQPSAGVVEFFKQSFVAGVWYDVLPILPLSQAAAHAAGMAHRRLVRDNAGWLARRDLTGVYKAIISLASVEMVAKRLPALSMRYFDFGGSGETTTTAKSLTAVRTGIPPLLADWFMHCTEGFVPVALGLAGASDVRVRCSRLDERGAPSGLTAGGAVHDPQTVAFRFDVSWV